jgi:hypothetical protein
MVIPRKGKKGYWLQLSQLSSKCLGVGSGGVVVRCVVVCVIGIGDGLIIAVITD